MQKKACRGQSSFEYLMIIVLMLAILLPAVYLAGSRSEYSKGRISADNFVSVLFSSIESLYKQGIGSSANVKAYLPGGYQPGLSYANGDTISIYFEISGGHVLNYTKKAATEVVWQVPNNPGYISMNMTLLSNGSVSIQNL
ncbi:MAG: hypothetical protein V1911_01215 [Candidatus Micrarchaeota archaeon]